MKKPTIVLVPFLLLLLLMFSACSGPLSPPGTDLGSAASRKIISKTTDAYGTVHEIGVLGPGAQYEIWVPAGWAAGPRGLVTYAHGYVAATAPIALPQEVGLLVGALLQAGFAVADSSYSQNGWAVKDAAIRTRQLRGYFEGNYGAPGKVFLVGTSEGGNVTLKLVQQNPDLFDGALALSGVVGSAQQEMLYILNQRILFDYFFRGTLKGLASADPTAALLDTALGEGALGAKPVNGLPSDLFAGMVAPIVGAILGQNPDKALALAMMTVDGRPMFNWQLPLPAPADFGMEMGITVATGLWFSVFGTQDMLQRTHGKAPVDTNTIVYYSPLLPPDQNVTLNSPGGVERLTSSPAAENYLAHWYQPTGSLQIPLVTLHTTRDPAVPIAQEYRLWEIAGNTSLGMLAQFESEGFGHVLRLMPPDYSLPDPTYLGQILAACNYLLTWVTYGLKPDPAGFGLTPLTLPPP
jgi:predicted esterase